MSRLSRVVIARWAGLFGLAVVALAGRARAGGEDSAPEAFWAFQPIARGSPPRVRQGAWVCTEIDRFILERLETHGLRPAARAGRRDLIRRVTLDLIGLPPTPAEVTAFEHDDSPGAYERVVDRLLASPHYGERWGRWWLDVARYADTNGQDENKVMANAWRYRDWVIRSFNDNLPFDEFVVAQLAGDLLPADEVDEAVLFDRWIATGFLVLGPKMLAEQDKPKLVMDIVDEQIDTVGRVFLGLTLGCARCHDHKFDPVPSRDYYALAGVFKSTRAMENLNFVSKFNERRVSPKVEVEAYEAHQKQLKEVNARVEAAVREANTALVAARKAAGGESPEKLPTDARSLYPFATRELLTALERERDTLLAHAPKAPDLALAVAEATPVDVPIHLRGNHLQPAKEPVPRGFLEVVARVNPAPGIPTNQSGRLQLARWLVAPGNPLTARVLVNRVWQAHFAEGLVRSADNFGRRGEPPSHPELLDWLATRFVDSGWDLKAMHRLIVSSAAYQQSSVAENATEVANRESAGPSGSAVVAGLDPDPDNRWLRRYPRRRLDAEAIRDSLLAVSGRLDRSMGGSLVRWKNDEYAPADEVSAVSRRRTVYLPIVRDRVYDALTLFDFANPSVTTARRVPTVVSQQALFFMNSPVVRDSASALARELLARAELGSEERIREAYAQVLGRAPSESELRRAEAFVSGYSALEADVPASSATRGGEAAATAVPWEALCQALLASNEFVYRP